MKSTSSISGSSRYPPNILKDGPPYKQCLVPVGQVEQADADPDTPFNPARPACRRIQRKAKTAADDPRLFVEAAQRVNPTHFQPRVGVQEHEPSAARVPRAVVHLHAAARRGSHPSHAGIPLAQGIQSGVARLAAVHDDDLEGGIAAGSAGSNDASAAASFSTGITTVISGSASQRVDVATIA